MPTKDFSFPEVALSRGALPKTVYLEAICLKGFLLAWCMLHRGKGLSAMGSLFRSFVEGLVLIPQEQLDLNLSENSSH